MKNVAAGANPMVMRRGISKAVEAAVEAIAKNSKKVNGTGDIARVGAISSGSDEIGDSDRRRYGEGLHRRRYHR